jgi:hypothetical protein
VTRRAFESERWVVLALLLCFAVARLLTFRAGVVLDATRVSNLWQVVEPELLRDDLARSLWYLHGQPPLFNAYLGLGLKLFGSSAAGFFHVVQLCCGACVALALFRTLRRCGAGLGLAALASLGFSLSPAAIVYEAWLFYPVFEAALMTAALAALVRYAALGSVRSGFCFFASAAGLVLLRSYFHLAWFLLLVGLALWLRPELRRRTLLCAALPFLLATLWYTKNAVLFGSFSSSSWLGMSFSRITIQSLGDRARKAFAQDGVVSPLARLDSFGPLSRYSAFVKPGPPTGVPVLDQQTKRNGRPNLHHAAYVELSRLYWRDSVALVKARPRIYWRGLLAALSQYLHSVTDDRRLDPLVSRLAGYNRSFDALVYGRRGDRCWAVACGLPLLVGFAWIAAVRARARGDKVSLAALGFCGLNVGFVSIAANAVELGENNRFRFAIEPLLVVLLALLADAVRRRWTAAGPR